MLLSFSLLYQEPKWNKLAVNQQSSCASLPLNFICMLRLLVGLINFLQVSEKDVFLHVSSVVILVSAKAAVAGALERFPQLSAV